jgi:hypothetical protein
VRQGRLPQNLDRLGNARDIVNERVPVLAVTQFFEFSARFDRRLNDIRQSARQIGGPCPVYIILPVRQPAIGFRRSGHEFCEREPDRAGGDTEGRVVVLIQYSEFDDRRARNLDIRYPGLQLAEPGDVFRREQTAVADPGGRVRWRSGWSRGTVSSGRTGWARRAILSVVAFAGPNDRGCEYDKKQPY